MKARILKLLNGPGLLLIALGMMTLQSTFFNSYPIIFFQPDGVLLMLLWIGMRREFVEGGVLSLLLGYLSELHSAAPAGLFMVQAMTTFLIVHFFNYQFQVLNKRSLLLVGALSSVFSHLLILFVLFLLNKADNQWLSTLRLLAPSAIVHAFLIGPVFKFFHRFDHWTLKNPNAEHQHERDFYLDEEFI